MSKQGLAFSLVNEFLQKKVGIHVQDLPDFDWYNWVEDDMTNEQVKELVPDIVWEMLDNSGMDRDYVNSICYPDEYEEE